MDFEIHWTHVYFLPVHSRLNCRAACLFYPPPASRPRMHIDVHRALSLSLSSAIFFRFRCTIVASRCICTTHFCYCLRHRCRSHRSHRRRRPRCPPRRPRPLRRRCCCRWFSRQAVKFDRRLCRFRRQLHKWQMQKRRSVSRALCARDHCEKTKVAHPPIYFHPSPRWSANVPVSLRITISLHNVARPKTHLSYFVDCFSRAPRLLRGISRPVVESVKYPFRRTLTWNCNFCALLPSSFSPSLVHLAILHRRRFLDRFWTRPDRLGKRHPSLVKKTSLVKKKITDFTWMRQAPLLHDPTSFDVLVDLFFTRTRELVLSARRIRWLLGWLITRE